MELKDFTGSIDSVDQKSFKDDVERRQALVAARELCRRLETPMDTIVRLCWVEPSTMVAAKVCKEAELFARMTEGGGSPKTTRSLAETTGMEPDLAARLLRHLSTVDFVRETGPEEYAPNELSTALAQPVVNGGLDFLFDVYLPPLTKLPDYFAEKGYRNALGVPGPFQYAVGEDIPLFGWYKQRPQKLQGFQNHMAGYTSARPGWLDIYDTTELVNGFEKSRGDVLLVDVGGGYGQDLDRFNAKHSNGDGRLVLQDQSHVVENAKCNEKIERMPHDFFTEQTIKGARGYFLHSILHDYDDKQCKDILTNLKPALIKGYSKLLINENVIPATKANAAATSMDLIMLCCMGATERKESQWETLLSSVGYKINKIYTSSAIESVIETELA